MKRIIETTAAILSVKEQTDLDECEQIIKAGQKQFIEVGLALGAIKDGKLYRLEYETFEEYCQKKWGFGRDYANKTVRAAKVVKSIGRKNGYNCIQNESQARALAQIPEEKRIAALKRVKSMGDVTAAAIKSVAPDYGAYTSAPVQPAPVQETNTDDLMGTILELVTRRQKVWAEKFANFPKTIAAEIVMAIKGRK